MSIAEKVYNFFCQYKDEIDLPWFSSFPNNCCEGASLFLGKVISIAHPDSSIFYVKGENLAGESHFWVEADGSVIDITIEQFEDVSRPVFSAVEHPLIKEFSVSEKIDINTAFKEYSATSDTYKNTILVNLNYLLNGECSE